VDAVEGKDRPEQRLGEFKMKLAEVLSDILKRDVSSTLIAFIYMIQLQKRGLPLAHTLLSLFTDYKIRANDDIHRVVCAELPYA
jgi:hypothetical protein